MTSKTKTAPATRGSEPERTTALVPRTPPDLTALATVQNESAAAFLAEAEGATDAPKKLPLIEIIHTQGKFVLPSGEIIEEISGYPVYYFNTRKMYKQAYRTGEKGKPPDCWSADMVRPHPSALDPQCETCAACPWSQFGSAADGRSQKCASMTWMFLVSPQFGPVPVAVLVLPPSSLRALFGTKFEAGYLAQAKARHGAYQIVWTHFRLRRGGGAQVAYVVIEPEMGEPATRENAQALAQLHNKFRGAFESFRGRGGDATVADAPPEGN